MEDLPDKQPRGWHGRGYLPHFDGGEMYQFITFHLADALPLKVIERWKRELEREKDETKILELHRRTEKYLDQGYGQCHLKTAEVAAQVQASLLYFHAVRYKLIGWVVMPNHVHFLLKPINGHSLSEIMQTLKSFTAHEVNKILRRRGQFWQKDYFDRYIRNHEHYLKTLDYIENNSVKAKLCEKRGDWKYSSAHHQ